MSRILFWIALFCLVVAAIRSKIRSAAVKANQAARDNASSAGSSGNSGANANMQVGQTEPMACCQHCHVYFPASEAVKADGQDYCSPAHVRLPPV